MSIQIKTLQEARIEKIADAFNLAFSDYFVAVHLTPEILTTKMKADKINLNYSVGAFEGEDLVAFILHGFDIIDGKKVVYNGGTGVIPKARGVGLTKQMYKYILPILEDEDIDYLILEAITENVQAIKSYEKVGYQIFRKVKCYRGQIELNNEAEDIEVRELATYDHNLMQSFWDFSPTWQNSMNVVKELKSDNKSFAAYMNHKLVGYIIFNPGSKRIQQLAVHPDFRRRGIASGLIARVIKEYGNELSAVNIDENSESTNLFFSKIGLENYIDQVEMKLVFS